MICPKILIPQWIEELDSKFGISACEAIGNQLRNVHNRKESVIVTTYQSASGFLEKNQPGTFDMLILDEAHKVRNLHGTNSPPRMATAIYNALEARHFKYVLMLTATPIQNRLWDIYSSWIVSQSRGDTPILSAIPSVWKSIHRRQRNGCSQAASRTCRRVPTHCQYLYVSNTPNRCEIGVPRTQSSSVFSERDCGRTSTPTLDCRSHTYIRWVAADFTIGSADEQPSSSRSTIEEHGREGQRSS